MSDDTPAPYRLPDSDTHPAIIAARLMELAEHSHLVDNDIEIDWLMRTDAKVKQGRLVLGTVYMPTVQGELRDMFEWMLSSLLGRLPQFLIVLDMENWQQASARSREILVFHELCHIKQKLDRFGAPRFDKDGRPAYGLNAHSVEEFTEVVARYGAYTDELVAFIDAATHSE